MNIAVIPPFGAHIVKMVGSLQLSKKVQRGRKGRKRPVKDALQIRNANTVIRDGDTRFFRAVDSRQQLPVSPGSFLSGPW